MVNKTILITGASGKLGLALLKYGFPDRHVLTPTHREMDITDYESVKRYFETNLIDEVIHCAAMTNMVECEKNPQQAMAVNLVGTANLVKEALKKPATRFMYLSTDYVYPGKSGPYSESDPVNPFNKYAWTKLAGECAVKLLSNHCIVRTSFFDPENILFDTAPDDSFNSKLPIDELAHDILWLLRDTFVGTINVGQERASAYEILKKHKPTITKVTLEEMSKGLIMKRAVDSSLDVSLWKKIRGIN